MKCPICHHLDTKVLESREADEGFSIRRRRECLSCEFRFSTFEKIEKLDINILKKNGEKENYSREKLTQGLKRAFEKRPITEDEFKRLISAIEREIQAIRKPEVSSLQVGEIIMSHLKKIDQIAYIRFASVYKAFNNADEFIKELKSINK